MKDVIFWLLQGDVSQQFLTHRDLIGSEEAIQQELQQRIQTEGFGRRLLSLQQPSGHWGLYYYQPKWTSTHYTLLELKNMGMPQTTPACVDMVRRLFSECQKADGSLNLSKYDHPSDICVDGMVLNYAAYFCGKEPFILSLVKHLITAQKTDGGFTWDHTSNHGDPHTTICVLEGFEQAISSSVNERWDEVKAAVRKASDFLLEHRLFVDDPDKRYRKLAYPFRYRYDLLRACLFFAKTNASRDSRMWPAIDWLLKKRQKDGLWHLELEHPGNVHFQLETVGAPSRFLTLKALMVLKYANLI